MGFLPKRVIRQFLERPRRDLRTAKAMTDVQLQQAVAALPTKPPIWSKLKQHQKVCFVLGVQHKRLALLLDMGCGKTLLSIALARYFKKAHSKQFGVTSKPNLVLVPRLVNKGEWVREIKKHSPSSSYQVLHGSSRQKWQDLRETKATFVIETYAGLTRMVCKKVQGRRGKNKFKPDNKLVAELCGRFGGLYLDESTCVKGHNTLAFRICRQLSKHVGPVFCLTGTPFGQDPTDLWSQLYLIDAGESLGPTLGLFRAAFFRHYMNRWGGHEWTFVKKRNKQLHRILAHSSIRYEADAADLPRVSEIRKSVGLPSDAWKYYNDAKAAVIAAKGNIQEMQNGFIRMRQISSGFFGYTDDETGEKTQYVFHRNPKLELLMSIIDGIRADKKIVVFHDFIFSGRCIADELRQEKVPFVQVWGQSKDAAGEVQRFQNDSRCRVLILQNSMVMGLNIQAASYGIFYESPLSVIMRQQARRRIERQFSEHDRVFIYDLLVRGTVDERILDLHRQGKELFQLIVNGGGKGLDKLL